jgi:hypothetical protein
MFRGDRQHLHHLLGNLVAHRRQVVAALYVTALLFCASAVLVAVTGGTMLGMIFLTLEIAAVFVLRRLGFARQARELAQERLEALRWKRPSWLVPSGVSPASPASPDESLPRASGSPEGAVRESR